MDELRPATQVYIAAIILAAIGATAVAITRLTALHHSSLVLAVAAAVLTALAYRFPLSIDLNTRTHLDTAAILAAVLMLEPGLAVPAVALGTLAINAVSLHAQDAGGWVQAAFNAGQTALQAAAGGLILAAAGWDPAAPRFDDPRLLGTMLVAAAAMHLVNTAGVATVIALQAGESPLRIWWQSSAVMDRTEALAHVSQLGLGLLAAIVAAAQPWALALLLLPAVAVHGGLQGHVRLRRRIEERLAVAQEIAHLGSWEWNVAADAHAWSDETFRILGHEPRAIAPNQRAFLDAVHPDDRAGVRDALTAIAAGAERSFEHRVRRPDGAVRVVHLIGEVKRDGRGRPVRVLGTVHDITERKRMEAILVHRAYHDPLTDLPNRALFEERLEQALARANRRASGLGILYLDLDGFKAVNDRLGHHAGDELLVAIADRLRASLRTEDTVTRRGGDEFNVLLEDLAHQAEAERVAARLVATLAQPYALDHGPVEVGVSVGVAYRPPQATPLIGADELLARADAALYAAKHRGKGRYVVAEQSTAAQPDAVVSAGPAWAAPSLVVTR